MAGKALRKSPVSAKTSLSRSPRVFLSYNSSDRDVATRFSEKLLTAGYQVANPAELVGPGENWLLVVGNALKNADAVVFLLSSSSVRSDTTTRELEYVLSTSRFKDRVIPVVLDANVALPWILRRLPLVTVGKTPADDIDRAAKAVVRTLDQRL